MSISFIPKNAKTPRTTRGGGWIPKTEPSRQKEAPPPSDKFVPTLKPLEEVSKPASTEQLAKLSLDSLTSAQQTALEALPAPAATALTMRGGDPDIEVLATHDFAKCQAKAMSARTLAATPDRFVVTGFQSLPRLLWFHRWPAM